MSPVLIRKIGHLEPSQTLVFFGPGSGKSDFSWLRGWNFFSSSRNKDQRCTESDRFFLLNLFFRGVVTP